MGKFITKFETETTFSAATESLARPHVSLTVDDGVVHYLSPYDDYAYVEIGGLKWATMNVGATSETDYGLYFQWGDTQGYTADQVGSGAGQKAFNWASYKWSDNGSSSVFTKYSATDHKTVLDLEDDAARANWGGQWRMPTTTEIQALGNAVNTTWTNDYQGSGVAGLVLTDKTDSSKKLFFPAAGGFDGNGRIGYDGQIWSSSLSNYDVSNAWYLYFDDVNIIWADIVSREVGFSVRGVIG